jgi:hypothetical protein
MRTIINQYSGARTASLDSANLAWQANLHPDLIDGLDLTTPPEQE